MTAAGSDHDGPDEFLRFKCLRCGQIVKVPRIRSGDIVHCPKCQRAIEIPSERPALSGTADRSSASSDPVRPLPHNRGEFDSNLDRSPSGATTGNSPNAIELPNVKVVYEKARDRENWTDPASRRVTVSRAVVWLQGILLLFVGVASFFWGTLFGRSLATMDGKPRETGQYLVLGRVEYQDARQNPMPDDGAVVICLPSDRRPDINAKAHFEGLRPGDPLPLDTHPALQSLRQIGGEYVRTDQHGQFQFRIGPGKHYVLFISNHATIPANREKNKSDLAQLGRYIDTAVDLIGEQNYEWREVLILRDRTINATF